MNVLFKLQWIFLSVNYFLFEKFMPLDAGERPVYSVNAAFRGLTVPRCDCRWGGHEVT